MISVIIPHYNQPKELERCLNALVAQRDNDAFSVEIVVVDNGSSPPPHEVVQKFENIRLLHEAEPGPGNARNLGCAETSGDILAFIDADCLPSATWLQTLYTELLARPNKIIGGDVRILLDDHKPLTVVQAYECEFSFRMQKYIKEQNFTGTGNMALSRKTFEAIGPFCNIHQAEDREWGQRAHSKGYITEWVPQMLVFHPARKDMAALREKLDRNAGHDYKMTLQKRFPQLRWCIRSLVTGFSAFPVTLRVLLSNRIPQGLYGKCLATIGLFNTRFYRMLIMLRLLLTKDTDPFVAKWRGKE